MADDPSKFLDSEVPHPEIPWISEIPERPPQDLVEDVRQRFLSCIRARIEPTIIVLNEERRKARDVGDTTRESVVENKIDGWSDALKSIETYLWSDQFAEWFKEIWKRTTQGRDDTSSPSPISDGNDSMAMLPPVLHRDLIRHLEKLQIDYETAVKEKEKRRKGGRPKKWAGLEEEIRKADKEIPKPHDDIIANRNNQRFSKRPPADATIVRRARYNMKHTNQE